MSCNLPKDTYIVRVLAKTLTYSVIHTRVYDIPYPITHLGYNTRGRQKCTPVLKIVETLTR